jgi:hypothetical protein
MQVALYWSWLYFQQVFGFQTDSIAQNVVANFTVVYIFIKSEILFAEVAPLRPTIWCSTGSPFELLIVFCFIKHSK